MEETQLYAIVLIACLHCPVPPFLQVTFTPACIDSGMMFQRCHERARGRCEDWILSRGMGLDKYKCEWRGKDG